MKIVAVNLPIFFYFLTQRANSFSTMDNLTSSTKKRTRRVNMIALSSTKTKVSDSTKTRPLHAKQIVKRIRDCSNDYNAALEILHENQPFLTIESGAGKKASDCSKGTFDAKPICVVINLLTKNSQFLLALDLLSNIVELHGKKVIPTYYLKEVYKSIIGMMAVQEQKESQNLHRQILQLIHIDLPTNTGAAPAIDVYHAALAALGKCRRIDCILDILNSMETNKLMTLSSENNRRRALVQYNFPSPDRLTYLTALSGSIKCKSPSSSIEILNRLVAIGMRPDKVIYNHVLSSLANTKSDERYEMTKIIWKEMEKENICTDATYKSLISIFSKENQYNDVAAVRERMDSPSASQSTILSVPMKKLNNPLTPAYIKDLEKLEKVDNVSKAWYKVGTIQSDLLRSLPNKTIIFGLQQHKNPIFNGVSLVFYTLAGDKLGFMLLRNHLESSRGTSSVGDRKLKVDEDCCLFSSIMGMKIEENFRGHGLAKVFIGLWIEICLRAGARPRSEMINKPLLSLALTNFGFIPTSDCKIEVEISRINSSSDTKILSEINWEPHFALYSSKALNFGERELRIQKMIVTKNRPDPRGKVTAVKTCFDHPMKTMELKQIVLERIGVLQIDTVSRDIKKIGRIEFDVDDGLLKRSVFGYLY